MFQQDNCTQVSFSFPLALEKTQGNKDQEQRSWLSSLPTFSELVLLARECPSVSSLVSASVRPDMVARALGGIYGVKSLTEGIGPMVFDTLLKMSEKDNLTGWRGFKQRSWWQWHFIMALSKLNSISKTGRY